MQTYRIQYSRVMIFVFCVLADVNNAIKFQHKTLIGFQNRHIIHNPLSSISKQHNSKNMQSRVTNLVFCRSDVVNDPVKFHVAILIGYKVTEGTPSVGYNHTAKSAIFHTKGP